VHIQTNNRTLNSVSVRLQGQVYYLPDNLPAALSASALSESHSHESAESESDESEPGLVW